MTTEEWRDVPGLTGYRVSSLGRVWRTSRKATGILKGFRQMGYWAVKGPRLIRHGPRANLYVHRLVALAFFGPPPEGHYANHKNGDKTDNRLENLEWASASHNNVHALENGLRRPHTKLTKGDPKKIRDARAAGERVAEIAHRFGVCPSYIYLLTNGDRDPRFLQD